MYGCTEQPHTSAAASAAAAPTDCITRGGAENKVMVDEFTLVKI